MSNKQLGYVISESSTEPSEPEVIENGDIVKVKATLQEANEVNRNGRKYGKKVLNDAIKSDYIQERLNTKTLYGEAGHPTQKDVKRQLSIVHEKISHIITDFQWEGNLLKGVVESALTPLGEAFAGLIKQGSKVAFSMRGTGNVSENSNGYVEVGSPLKLFSYDWVVHPSHKKAYMEEVIKENSLEKYFEGDNNDVLTESTNNTGNSGILIPLQQGADDFVKENSNNVKKVTNQLDISEDAILTVTSNGQLVQIQENGDIFNIYLEDYIQKELDRYLLNV